MATIETLKTEEAHLESLLYENRQKQKALNTEEFIKKHGINIGDRISWESMNKQLEGVVWYIEYTYPNDTRPAYYHALLINSNGMTGRRDYRIWDHELKTVKIISKAQQ